MPPPGPAPSALRPRGRAIRRPRPRRYRARRPAPSSQSGGGCARTARVSGSTDGPSLCDAAVLRARTDRSLGGLVDCRPPSTVGGPHAPPGPSAGGPCCTVPRRPPPPPRDRPAPTARPPPAGRPQSPAHRTATREQSQRTGSAPPPPAPGRCRLWRATAAPTAPRPVGACGLWRGLTPRSCWARRHHVGHSHAPLGLAEQSTGHSWFLMS